jgi:predicted transport protein
VGEIKLFKKTAGGMSEVQSQTVLAEKTLQNLFEEHLEAILGIRFLATEYSTGATHGGRIDTLGIDEDNTPVIIEFKRSLKENVINQGLFYLDWLMDHKKEFEWLVLERFGKSTAQEVDWAEPRLICVAGDFTRYDEYAVKQMQRNIELLRYRRYEDDLLLVELVHAPNFSARSTTKPKPTVASTAELETASEAKDDAAAPQGVAYRIGKTTGSLKDLFDSVYQYLQSLGDDVQVSQKKMYVAFKRLKNFACLEVYPQAGVVTVFLKVDPSSIQLQDGFTRDVSNIGHYGTGDLQVTLRTMGDFEKAQPLFNRSYDGS